MQRTRYTRQTVETSKLPCRGTFSDNRPDNLHTKTQNFREKQNRMNNCTTNRQNYTVKDFCSNKTLKIDENCKEKPTLHFAQNVVEKSTATPDEKKQKNNGSVTVSVVFIQLNHANFCIFCCIATSKFQRRCTKNFNTCANICYQSALPIP